MTTAFVLTGGGSLGAVQVGMLQALAAHGIEPDLVVGTSAGALNAGWVATRGAGADSLADLADLWCRIRRRDVFAVDPRRVLSGLTGHSSSLLSSGPLRSLIEANTPRGCSLGDTEIPVQVITADMLTGQTVALSSGPLVGAVLASAAIPGIFPPVEGGGRLLVDGGVADRTGIAVAADEGADEIYVLPAGTSCALPRPPRSALGCAVHAFTLLVHERTARDVALFQTAVRVRVLPPLCPMRTSATDFAHAADLIARSHTASEGWLASGGLELPAPERFLAPHMHANSGTTPHAIAPRLAQPAQILDGHDHEAFRCGER